MYSFDEALRLVAENTAPLLAETVSLPEAAGRVLAVPVTADRDLPPFPRSERDGYAVRSADFQNGDAVLRPTGVVIYAGEESADRLSEGECVKIMTGAPLPNGADAVAMIEYSLEEDGAVKISEPDMCEGLYVHRQGIDAAAGTELLSAGNLLQPGCVAVAAAVGASELRVSRKIRVAILSTGDEMVEPSASPRRFEIRECNGPGLYALLSRIPWIEPSLSRIVPDDQKKLRRAVEDSLEKTDVLILSGGVSMGEKDMVPGVLHDCGVARIFHKVAIRPGKPTWFGKSKNDRIVFGLPGNPMSFQVTFREFALCGLRHMAGFADIHAPAWRVPVAAPIQKELPLRVFTPARLTTDNDVSALLPLDHHGSGDFVTTAGADGVIVLPEGPQQVEKGEPVLFHPWGYPG